MIQGQELLVILLVALIVLGPQRLPDVARRVGSWSRELRRAAQELRAGLEAEVGDVRQVADDLSAPLKEVKKAMRDVERDARDAGKPVRWVGPEPSQGPTSADAMEDLERIEEADKDPTEDPPEPRMEE